jgi:carbonic anhydrase
MSATDDLLRNAERYAAGFDKGDLAAPPRLRVAVLTCMDARIVPARILGFDEGDAHVIRNGGGVASDDAIRSLAISQHMLGTEEIVVIQHTQCGMLTFTDEEFRERMKEDAGEAPEWPIHTLSDLDGGVRESVTRLRESPFIPRKGSIRGFVYDVETGKLREVS